MRKSSLRGVKWFAQTHTASNYWRTDLNSDFLTSGPALYPLHSFILLYTPMHSLLKKRHCPFLGILLLNAKTESLKFQFLLICEVFPDHLLSGFLQKWLLRGYFQIMLPLLWLLSQPPHFPPTRTSVPSNSSFSFIHILSLVPYTFCIRHSVQNT